MTGLRKFVRRAYQKLAVTTARRTRTLFLFWARQCRKSTTLGDLSFDAMSEKAGQTVIAASASLLTGSELVSKTISAAEQAISVTREADAMRAALENQAGESGGKIQMLCANSETGKVYSNITPEDYRDLYRSKKLEMRLHFDRTSYSRLLIIAPNPVTARGWTGKVFRDEAMFTNPDMERELRIAVKPIMDTDPTFNMIYASNLCAEDRHPAFEETLPEPGMVFPVNPKGNFYRGQNGILIHRVTLADAYAAGHVLYDTREGKPMTYEEFCADPANKLGINLSYRLIHEFGGAAAIDLLALTSAQRRGVGASAFAFIDSQPQFLRAINELVQRLSAGPVGLGFDPATTTGDTSNPSSFTVTEGVGSEFVQRGVFCWKERDPKVVIERIKFIVQGIASRMVGGRARRLCIDSTSEQYFARFLADELSALIPCELVDARNKVEPVPPGYKRDPIYKTWQGDIYSAAINENHYTCPADVYFKDDHRLVTKSGGLYSCEPQPDGKHGDTFDSGKHAHLALVSDNGPGEIYVFGDTRRDQILADRRQRTIQS